MKRKFDIVRSTCVPLPLENVDTDQIIPARFLKATDKKDSATIFSAIGVIILTVPRKILYLTTLHIAERYLWLERTSAVVQAVNMRHGLSQVMDSA